MIRGSDVTVVIPTIPGRDDYLRRAIRSVEAQQVKPGRVVVNEDVSRMGAAWCRNDALQHVETEWIAWLDDDDELLPNHIKVLVRGANKSHADLIFTYAEFVGRADPLAVLYNGRLQSPLNVPWDAQSHAYMLQYGNFIPITYLVRADLVRKVGGFPEQNSFGVPKSKSGDCEDYGLLLRLLDAGATFHHVLGVRTWRYHVHGENTGGRGADATVR